MKYFAPFILIVGILMAIFYAIDANRNPQDYSSDDNYAPSSWCSGIYCD